MQVAERRRKSFGKLFFKWFYYCIVLYNFTKLSVEYELNWKGASESQLVEKNLQGIKQANELTISSMISKWIGKLYSQMQSEISFGSFLALFIYYKWKIQRFGTF